MPHGPMEPANLAIHEQMLACQAAVEYGINIFQLEYILTLTPAERLKSHDAASPAQASARKTSRSVLPLDFVSLS